MSAKRSASSSFQNQSSKKKTFYGNYSSVDDVFSTADTQDISEWLAKEVKPNNQVEDLEPLVINEDEDTGIEHFIISEQKKVTTYTNQNKEFVKLELVKKNKDSSETYLSLKQETLRKLTRLLPQLQKQYMSALQGQKINVRYKLSDDIYVSCNNRYLCVDLRVFYTPKGDTTGTIRPTRRGISFNFNETKCLREIVENIDAKLNINALVGYLESDD